VDFREAVQLAWKQRLLILTVLVLSVGGAALFAFSREEQYASDVQLAITPRVLEGDGTSGFIPPAETVSTVLQTFSKVAASDRNISEAEESCGGPLPGSVSSSTDVDHAVLTITGKGDTPESAATTARLATESFLDLAPTQLVDIRQLNRARPPTSALPPHPPLIIGVAALLGLIAGFLLALFAEQIRQRIDSVDEFAEITDAPIVGHVPSHETLSFGPRLLWNLESTDPIADRFRDLRNNLHFLIPEPELPSAPPSARGDGETRLRQPNSVVQLTSASRGQGVSMISANLAVAYAQVGDRTLLVDANLRQPVQHEYFELPNDVGLSTKLSTPAIDELIRPTVYPNLSVLTAGPMIAGVTDLLHARFGDVLASLGQGFDTVLIDSPPLVGVSDSQSVAMHASGVFLVSSLGREKSNALREAVRKLTLIGRSPSGLIVNRAPADVGGGGRYRVTSGTGLARRSSVRSLSS
jgi:capsular exopolysaccharide synthesis family protein